MSRNTRRTEPRVVVVSKTLSRVLRHSAEQEKIQLTPQGYAKVSDMLKWRKAKSLNIVFDEILDTVVENNKQRFALLYQPPFEEKPTNDVAEVDKVADAMKDLSMDAQRTSTEVALEKAKEDQDPSHYWIRATQGHSLKLESAEYLEPITLEKPGTLPKTAVHGTFHAAWPLILKSGGFKPRSRVHCHFASGPSLDEVLPEGIAGPIRPGDTVPGQGRKVVISGMRSDAQILIYINVRKALEAGLQFWRSENGVILSEGKEDANGLKMVSTDFFDVVVESKEKLGVLWKDGKVTQELPEPLIKVGMPRGKGERDHAPNKGNRSRKRNRKPTLNVDPPRTEG